MAAGAGDGDRGMRGTPVRSGASALRGAAPAGATSVGASSVAARATSARVPGAPPSQVHTGTHTGPQAQAHGLPNGSPGARAEVSFPAVPAERAVARLLREAVDLDGERGLAILGADRRAIYSNTAARALLRDGTERGLDGLLPQAVDQAVEGLLMSVRMQRTPLTVEVFYPSEAERRLRLSIEAVWHDLGLYVIVRATPVTPWIEPTVRRLQTRFGLTLREAQVAVGVARGQSNAEVAASLGIVEKTVKNVLMSVYQKCDVRNRVELALRAYDAPLASAEARP